MTSGFAMRIFSGVICDFHHAIETGFPSADVQNADESGMGSGNRFEFLQAAELTLVGPLAVKGRAINHLYGPQSTHNTAGKPDLTVAALTDFAEQFMIGDSRWLVIQCGKLLKSRLVDHVVDRVAPGTAQLAIEGDKKTNGAK